MNNNQNGSMNPNYKHGGTKTKLFGLWKDIKKRCYNKSRKQYKDYGGRGIIICPEWANDYTKFRDWSLNNGYQEGLEIDRINNDGNYSPENCRFVTKQENIRNSRATKLTLGISNEIKGLWNTGNYTQQELAEKFELHQTTISCIILNKIWKN